MTSFTNSVMGRGPLHGYWWLFYLSRVNKQQNKPTMSLHSCRVTLLPARMKLQLFGITTGYCNGSVNTLTTLCYMGKMVTRSRLHTLYIKATMTP